MGCIEEALYLRFNYNNVMGGYTNQLVHRRVKNVGEILLNFPHFEGIL